MERFEVTGWFDGESDCDPPEPGKRWLNIGIDGDEFCIVVQRQVNGQYWEQISHEKEERARLVAEALNEYWSEFTGRAS